MDKMDERRIKRSMSPEGSLGVWVTLGKKESITETDFTTQADRWVRIFDQESETVRYRMKEEIQSDYNEGVTPKKTVRVVVDLIQGE